LSGDVWYDTNDSNKLYLWTGAAWVYSPDAVITGSVTAVDSRVTTVENTKIGYCTIGGLASDDTNKAACEAAGGTWNVGIPIATAVKQVSVSDGDDSATLEQRFTAQKTLNDGLQAEYTIKLDVNGNVAGYGIYGGEGGSEFIANVDRFAVTTPQTSIQVRAISTTYAQGAIARVAGQDSKTLVCKIGGSTGTGALTVGAIGTLVTDGTVTWQVASRVPFAVQAVPTEINGQPVPAGVYIDAAYVLNATVQNTQIADLAVDNAKIASLNVGKLTAGSISADQYIQSSNYVAGSQGFRLDANGQAEFQNATVRGAVFAETGTFAGSLSAATGTFSGSLSAATGSFAGSLSAATGSFAGSLSAATGSFAGSLSAATGSFAGSLSAATGSFSGSLTADAVNAVNTINIAGNAVTIPVGVYSSGLVSAGQVQSATITSSGGPVSISAGAVVIPNNQNSETTVTIKRNGDTILTFNTLVLYYDIGNPGQLVSTPPLIDTPSAGVNVYTLEISQSAKNRGMLLLEVKR
jgi:hypothetical protein